MAGAAVEERFFEAAGIEMRALVEGPADEDAGSLLVLHGFTGAAESMAGVAEALRSRFRIARLDLVGHGRSAAPEDVSVYSMPACVDQIVAAARALDLGSPHLLGYSMGGRAALSAAIAHPDFFSSLTLIGATAGLDDPDVRRERIAADRALADRIEAEGLEAFVDHWMALPIFASQIRLGEAALATARAQRLASRPRGLAHSLRGMGAGAQPPLHDRLDRLRIPVLLVVGEEDAKFRAIADSLEAGLADARTCVLPEAGHAAHLEAPEAFARIVSGFLANADETRAAAGQGGIR